MGTPWDGSAAPVLTQDSAVPGRHLVIGRLDNGLFVLDDVAAGRRLGSVELISVFAVEIDGCEHIVVAGTDRLAESVTVEIGADAQRASLADGVWMTQPRPFVSGVTVTVRWDHGDGELRFTTRGPLASDDLVPRRSQWTGYAEL